MSVGELKMKFSAVLKKGTGRRRDRYSLWEKQKGEM